MVRVIACINTFQSVACVAKTIDSIIRHVDRLVVVDGAYPDFPAPYDFSQDGTIEVVEALQRQHPTKIAFHVLKKRRSEIEKRSLFFQEGGFEEGDLAFIIDGDEVAHGDVREGLVQAKVESAIDIFDVDVVEFDPEDERVLHALHPRLIRFHEGMCYEGNHYTIVDGRGRVYNRKSPENRQLIPDFKLIHLPFLGSDLYRAQKRLYLLTRREEET